MAIPAIDRVAGEKRFVRYCGVTRKSSQICSTLKPILLFLKVIEASRISKNMFLVYIYISKREIEEGRGWGCVFFGGGGRRIRKLQKRCKMRKIYKDEKIKRLKKKDWVG